MNFPVWKFSLVNVMSRDTVYSWSYIEICPRRIYDYILIECIAFPRVLNYHKCLAASESILIPVYRLHMLPSKVAAAVLRQSAGKAERLTEMEMRDSAFKW